MLPLRLNELAAEITGEFNYKLMHEQDLIKEFMQTSDALELQWLRSDRQDYSIYSHPEYWKDNFVCYALVTRKRLESAIRWIRKNEPTLMKPGAVWLDHWNGIGISTAHMKLAAPNVHVKYYNEDAKQAELTNMVSMYYDVLKPEIYSSDDTADVVFSFEVIEHYKNPLEYVAALVKCMRPGSHLVYCSGFDNPEFAGHFAEYEAHGRTFSNKQIVSVVNDALESELELVHVGPTCKPMIYKKTH